MKTVMPGKCALIPLNNDMPWDPALQIVLKVHVIGEGNYIHVELTCMCMFLVQYSV